MSAHRERPRSVCVKATMRTALARRWFFSGCQRGNVRELHFRPMECVLVVDSALPPTLNAGVVNELNAKSASERPPTCFSPILQKSFSQNKKMMGPLGQTTELARHDRPFRSVTLTGDEALKAMATTTRPPNLNRSGSSLLPRAGDTQGRSFVATGQSLAGSTTKDSWPRRRPERRLSRGALSNQPFFEGCTLAHLVAKIHKKVFGIWGGENAG